MPESATHRTIVLVDVAGFTHPGRTMAHHVAVRAGLYKVLKEAFAEARVDWSACHHEDRGDGVMILVPSEVPAFVLADQLLERIVSALREHNAIHAREASIRLRLVLHSGPIEQDEAGVAGPELNVAFRLLAAPVAKERLHASTGVLAVVASDHFYRNVIAQKPAAAPESYEPIKVEFGGFSGNAWFRLLGQMSAPGTPAPMGWSEVLSQFSEQDMKMVREWLSEAAVPDFNEIARRAAKAALPLPRFDDPWHAFVWLVDVNAGSDGVPPSLVYIDALATEAGGELGRVMAGWVAQKVRELEVVEAFGEHRRTMSRTAGEQRLHLLISLDHDGIEPGRCVLSVWRQDDPEVWPPARSDIRNVELNHVEQVFDQAVVSAEEAWARQRAVVTLEVLLPRDLVHLPVHAWSKEHESGQPQPLCLDYIIRLRSLDRLKSRFWHRSWRERWRSLQADPSPSRIHFAGANGGTERVDVLLRSQDSVAMVLNAPPPPRPDGRSVDEFTAALRSGLPVLFWHPDASPEALRDLVMWLVSGGSLIDLPERTQESRRAALGASAVPFDRDLARDLVVLWDDPERIVVLDRSSNASP